MIVNNPKIKSDHDNSRKNTFFHKEKNNVVQFSTN